MRINIDRLCELAGVSSRSRYRNGILREGAGADHGDSEVSEEADGSIEEESDMQAHFDSVNEMDMQSHFDSQDEGSEYNETMNDPMEEIVEINEADLVKELRRARVIMKENRRRKARSQQKLQEMQLKGIIDQEVKNVLKELQLTSGWVYGKNKPTRSRRGYTHQGSYLKGLGFK